MEQGSPDDSTLPKGWLRKIGSMVRHLQNKKHNIGKERTTLMRRRMKSMDYNVSAVHTYKNAQMQVCMAGTVDDLATR